MHKIVIINSYSSNYKLSFTVMACPAGMSVAIFFIDEPSGGLLFS
jgi:hypothetical protein